jgi:coenzyme F420-reducing hydrogenase gamma subunit
MNKSELLTKILTNRINTAKANGETDFTEIKNTMDIFLAGGSITSEQYATLVALIPVTTTTAQ